MDAKPTFPTKLDETMDNAEQLHWHDAKIRGQSMIDNIQEDLVIVV